jgi:hypothetical protein
MSALIELVGVILAGFAAFFSGIVFLLGLVVLWLCGLASALCLMVAIFAGVMYWITGTPHDAQLAVVYFVYAAVPFVASFVLSYYGNKVIEGRRRRQALRNIGGLRLAPDADFTPGIGVGRG